ncbi:hypothetical protein T492DRAFT_993114 [Pavlovales sp. CCMP2436]|nr:hypothetical protein T492DRAFT_993114 [Pavlovales sp. CCMP2436]|mmetsp:Transcript_13035/g.33105  ORF Transcript_13035/g.33105 Transcript_13035/m.33105 type:complete len:413 (-) Transcript_13035:238-1476(-)
MLGMRLSVLAALIARGACSSYDPYYGGARPVGGQPPPGGQFSGAPPALGRPQQGFGPGDGGIGDEQQAQQRGGSPLDKVQEHFANGKAMVQGAARHARWFNVANGLLLMLTGPFNIILSALTLKLVDVLTSAYLSLFGVLLVAMEVPLGSLQRPMREYFKFLYTRFGRAFFLVLVSNLAMVCGKIGFITASLTVVNAALNVYLLGRNREQSGAEAGLVSDAMEQMRSEVSGQLGGMLGPMRLLGGLPGGLMGMLPFGRKKQGLADGIESESFDNPFTSGAEQRPAEAGRGGPQGPGAQGAQPQSRAEPYSRRDTSEGPGGRSPFVQGQVADGYSPFVPRQPSAFGQPQQPPQQGSPQQPYRPQQPGQPRQPAKPGQPGQPPFTQQGYGYRPSPGQGQGGSGQQGSGSGGTQW